MEIYPNVARATLSMEYAPTISTKSQTIESATKMKPISTREQLPPCVSDGESEVWWYNKDDQAWYIGFPMLMDLEDDNILDKWTHWLPEEVIPIPE